jgi:HSF-type DNA-binding
MMTDRPFRNREEGSNDDTMMGGGDGDRSGRGGGGQQQQQQQQQRGLRHQDSDTTSFSSSIEFLDTQQPQQQEPPLGQHGQQRGGPILPTESSGDHFVAPPTDIGRRRTAAAIGDSRFLQGVPGVRDYHQYGQGQARGQAQHKVPNPKQELRQAFEKAMCPESNASSAQGRSSQGQANPYALPTTASLQEAGSAAPQQQQQQGPALPNYQSFQQPPTTDPLLELASVFQHQPQWSLVSSVQASSTTNAASVTSSSSSNSLNAVIGLTAAASGGPTTANNIHNHTFNQQQADVNARLSSMLFAAGGASNVASFWSAPTLAQSPPPAVVAPFAVNSPNCSPNDESHLTFPNRLFAILDDQRLADIISWLPHGKGFRILDKKRFEVDVMPLHFGKKSKYTSFTRKRKLMTNMRKRGGAVWNISFSLSFCFLPSLLIASF